ncbi:MAG TPA: MFS transporter [Gaiellaceae bacterium]|nr:MFS transporter [Gaiellaceae bacterium]
MSRLGGYLRTLDPRLPRSVWILNLGGLANAVGNGLAFPFLVIYLHNVRGISLATAGLVLATTGAVSLLCGPAVGVVVDRIGGRATLAGALVLLALGFGSYPLVREPWHAFLAAGVAGVGNAGFWPSQSALMAGLTPQARRHGAFALQRVTRNLGIGLGGVAGGLIATTSDPTSFTVLFALDAATFLVFVAMLPLVPEPALPDAGDEALAPARYRDVLANRVFLGIVLLNVLFVSAGYAQFELLPVFAKNEAGVSESGIGIIFFVNTLAIVLAQFPVAKALEGRRRMPALAAMTVLWALAWLVVLAGGHWLEAVAAAVAFGAAAVVFGLGECFQGPVQGALVADLAPPRLRGRYMAVSTISWDIGFIVGPAVGGVVLGAEPLALWPLAAVVCLLAGAAALGLERGLPRPLRLTPA